MKLERLIFGLAEIQGRKVPVRLAFRIPVIPDGVFKLRTVPAKSDDSSEVCRSEFLEVRAALGFYIN